LKVFATIPSSWVVWDADHPKNESPDHPYDLKSVRYILLKAVPHAQTFALTDVPIGLLPDHPKFSFLLNYPQHNLIRNYSQATSTFYSSIFKQFSKSDVSDFKNYFPKGAKFQEITLTESKHRIPAVDAIDSFFQKCSLAKRLAAKIAQATDELLMNALFDAPVENGNRIRHFLPRTAEFTVAKGKEVRLEAGIGDELCGICVTDRYGSSTN
jgi:hypothetical protein